MPNFGQRLADTFSMSGQLCVGIDPSQEQLSKWNLPDSALGAKEFAVHLLAACEGQVGIIKPQVAFFEQYGAQGLTVLSEILVAAKASDFIVIADAKRGDIGTTMDGYSRAWLSSEAVFLADAITLSPFLGVESLRPTVQVALENQRGVFLLAATSNPEAATVQAAMNGNQSVASSVVKFASSFNDSWLGSVGVVIGANVTFPSIGISSEDLSSTPILMPGFGAQGSELGTAGISIPGLEKNAIFSVSRSVAGTTQTGLESRIAGAKIELMQGIPK